MRVSAVGKSGAGFGAWAIHSIFVLFSVFLTVWSNANRKHSRFLPLMLRVKFACFGLLCAGMGCLSAFGWSPTDQRGCIFFVWADSLTTLGDEGRVYQWNDGGPSGANFYAVGNTNYAILRTNGVSGYLNRQPYVHFNGVTSWLTNRCNFGGVQSWFIVAAFGSYGNGALANSSGGNGLFLAKDNLNIQWGNSSVDNVYGQIGIPVLYDGIIGGTAYTNGVATAGTLTGYLPIPEISVGGFIWGALQSGDIAFIGCWTNLSAADVSNVRSNLGSKYQPLYINQAPSTASHYVTTNGSPCGDGSPQNPWDLATSISSAATTVKPGDTIWIRAGTYTNAWTPYVGAWQAAISGSASAPIIIRNYQNERVILDGASTNSGTVLILGSGADATQGSYLWVWGLEVMNSQVYRAVPNGSGQSGPAQGVLLYGAGDKLINMIVHDVGNGVFSAQTATNSEVVGCLIYNNGWDEVGNRGHGHGFYAQNNVLAPVKTVRDCILFDQFGFGIQLNGSAGLVKGFDILGNTVFENGAISSFGRYKNIELYTGNTGMDGLYVRSNVCFATAGEISLSAGTGIAGDYQGGITLSNNWLLMGTPLISQFTNVVFLNNVVASPGIGNQLLAQDDAPSELTQTFDYNDYHWPLPYWDTNFYIYRNETNYNYNNWHKLLGRDMHSSVTTNMLTGVNSFVRPNPYESGRAHITILNWNTNDNVNVDISGVLSVGSAYQVRNAMDYFAPPVKSGTYSGGLLSLPMTNLTAAAPLNWTNLPPIIGPRFNVFVLLPVQAIQLAPASNLKRLSP